MRILIGLNVMLVATQFVPSLCFAAAPQAHALYAAAAGGPDVGWKTIDQGISEGTILDSAFDNSIDVSGPAGEQVQWAQKVAWADVWMQSGFISVAPTSFVIEITNDVDAGLYGEIYSNAVAEASLDYGYAKFVVDPAYLGPVPTRVVGRAKFDVISYMLARSVGERRGSHLSRFSAQATSQWNIEFGSKISSGFWSFFTWPDFNDGGGSTGTAPNLETWIDFDLAIGEAFEFDMDVRASATTTFIGSGKLTLDSAWASVTQWIAWRGLELPTGENGERIFKLISHSDGQEVPRVPKSTGIITRGDFDGDGDADGADFLTWQRILGSNVTAGSGPDSDGDGVIGFGDLEAWKNADTFKVAENTVSVPEPSSAALLLIGLATLRRANRRGGKVGGKVDCLSTVRHVICAGCHSTPLTLLASRKSQDSANCRV